MTLSPGFVAPKATESDFKAVESKKEKSLKDLHEENEKQAKRIAFLEAELVKRDAKIKELSE